MKRTDERLSAKSPPRKTQKAMSSATSAPTAPSAVTLTLPQVLDHAKQHLRAGRLPQAEVLFRQILQKVPGQPDALQLLGVIAFLMNKFDQADELISKALAAKPQDADAHNNLANVWRNQGKLDQAIASYRRGAACAPASAVIYTDLGIALRNTKDLTAAVASLRTAVASRADFIKAQDNLAELLEQMNLVEELRQALAVAKQACPGNPQLMLREAQLLKRDGDFAGARAILEAAERESTNGSPGNSLTPSNSLTPGNNLTMVAQAQLLGDLCDRLGDVDAAFDAFLLANQRHAATIIGQQADGQRFQAKLSRLRRQFTPTWIDHWQPVEPEDDRPDPDFLVGFPRSGTTLLDTILRSHSAIAVLEETPALDTIVTTLEQRPGGYPEALATLTTSDLADLRRRYFDARDSFLPVNQQAQVVIDKFPLHSVHVGMMHRIFPKARFLFAERHPCDCVLSCFMQSFKLNDAMANFLDLAETARLYDQVLSLWQHYQTLLPLRVHGVRYERLLDSFEPTIGAVIEFLGLPWEESLLNYAATAQQRDKINTPSYNQVIQPLYTRARGRWRRYRSHMRPILPILEPWIRELGYDEGWRDHEKDR